MTHVPPLHSDDRHRTVTHESPAGFPGLEQVLARWRRDPHALIEILHAAQQMYGWLDRPLLGHVARELQLPPSLVYGVAGFYHAFRLTPPARSVCTVCTGTSCHLKGSGRLLAELEARLGITGGSTAADGALGLEQVHCLGACDMAPLVRISHRDTAPGYLGHTDRISVELLVQKYLTGISHADDAPGPAEILGNRQGLAVLEGAFDTEEQYGICRPRPYAALRRALQQLTPAEVCRMVTESGLRGRGGAGFPTGRKWELVRRARGRRRYVVANGDEGDPGAFMDRTLMERDPHRVLEGMAIAGYAVGADTGFVYVRGEYPLAAERLRQAIAQAEGSGDLGRRLSGTGFSFSVSVRIGAGAYVCGEETALTASITGRRAQPVIRPPYPSDSGLWGRPTLINNVETFGTVTGIIGGTAAEVSTVNLHGSTKIFSVSGDVARVGVVEVPLGTTMREVLTLAGGVTGGAFKAAQTGGAGGGCLTGAHLDLPLDYESLAGIGSMMGSGGIVVLNDRRCMVDLARFFMQFCCDESCGKCSPCRAGTRQALRILDRVRSGAADESDLEQLEELCGLMKETSLCGLGMAAPTPVLSILRWYRPEVLAHLHGGRCPAGVCNTGGAS